MKLFLHLAYRGTKYRGWQRQPLIKTIQQTLEDTISKMIGVTTTVYGCGRTDAGVHALQYIAHIEVGDEWNKVPDPVFRLNKMLPSDISIFQILPVEETAHARYTATWRTYNFLVHTQKDALLEDCSTLYLSDKLDLKAMQRAANLLISYKDFRPLCRQPDIHDSTICDVVAANVYTNRLQNRVRFEIKANRFLKSMVRLTMARLMEVGQGDLAVEEFEQLLVEKGNADELIRSAHPQGLYLTKVEYDFVTLPAATNFMGLGAKEENHDWELVEV